MTREVLLSRLEAIKDEMERDRTRLQMAESYPRSLEDLRGEFYAAIAMIRYGHSAICTGCPNRKPDALDVPWEEKL